MSDFDKMAELSLSIANNNNNNSNSKFSCTLLTPKDDEVHDLEAYYIVNHNYCYMPKYTDRY